MKFAKPALFLFIAIMPLLVQSVFAQENKKIWAEQIILSYIEAKGLDIHPSTEEYANLMKGILLGEHPDLTGKDSIFVTSDLERDYVIDYAAALMNLEAEKYLGGFEEPDVKEVKQVISERGQESRTAFSSLTSNRSNAIDYAYTWSISGGTSRNPAYPDFGADDCTNFISQAMHAGGFAKSGSGDGCKHEDTSTKWYVNANPSPPLWCIGDFRNWEWSTSWSVPWPFRNYFAYQNSFAIEHGWTLDASVAKYYLSPGDVVQLQYKDGSGNWISYHTMIATMEDDNELYVTYHSNAGGLDEVDKPLSSIPTGSSQRYVLVTILYPMVYLPIVINSGSNAVTQLDNLPPNPYPEPMQPNQSTLSTPYPAP